MPQLMDRLLGSSLVKEFRVRLESVKLLAESRKPDDGDPGQNICLSENKVEFRNIEVLVDHPKQ